MFLSKTQNGANSGVSKLVALELDAKIINVLISSKGWS